VLRASVELDDVAMARSCEVRSLDRQFTRC
jgi:hypothetical protein